MVASEANQATVRLPDASTLLKVRTDRQWEAGGEVTLAARPERILLGTHEAHCPNQLRGMVEEVMYLGTLIQYTIIVPVDQPVIVHQPNFGLETTPRYTRGSQVTLGWQPEHAVML